MDQCHSKGELGRSAIGDANRVRSAASWRGREGAHQVVLWPELHRYCRYLEARNYSPFTIETRSAIVRAFIAWLTNEGLREWQDLTAGQLEAFRQRLREHRQRNGDKLALRTQIVRLSALRTFLNWLHREGMTPVAAATLDLPRGEKCLPAAVLTERDVAKVLALANTQTALGLRDRAILELLYVTAIRRLELVRLNLDDVDYARQRLMIRKGKGGKGRVAPTGERALLWLARYLNEARPQLVGAQQQESLFVTSRGARIQPKKLSDRISSYVRAAQLNKRGACHLFRHAAATHMLEHGADIRYIQALLGHESLHTTQIYTHVNIAGLAAVHAATHPGAR